MMTTTPPMTQPKIAAVPAADAAYQEPNSQPEPMTVVSEEQTAPISLWVPTMPSPHATCEYAGATGILPSGGLWLRVRCGRWVL